MAFYYTNFAGRLRTQRTVQAVRTIPGAPSAAELALRLEAEGWTAGPPPRVAPAMLAVDRHNCRSLCCPGCGHRGLRFTPFSRGRRYTAVAACLRCGAGMEL
jgi:hypothetical protein